MLRFQVHLIITLRRKLWEMPYFAGKGIFKFLIISIFLVFRIQLKLVDGDIVDTRSHAFAHKQ